MSIQEMTPAGIVKELDRFIVGQHEAKRAVAIALRNRWRRMQLDESLRKEITPKNILMIGPTGVGKTEIARRLASLSGAPFIKVEATKFTEVGYVGRDVESIIRDLADVAVKLTRDAAMDAVLKQAKELAIERILDVLVPLPKEEKAPAKENNATRTLFRQKLESGKLDDKKIDIEVAGQNSLGLDILGPPGMEEMIGQIQNLMQSTASKQKKSRRMKVSLALKHVTEEEAAKLINEDEIKAQALENLTQNGIVFLDEIDKIAKPLHQSGGEVSREGVQRDLLPLVEGCTVSTKHGIVKTDHILFIASGAFHLSKPSDLVPELQGRFPIRVELNALTSGDLVQILTEPDASLTEQYTALLKTEGLQLKWTKTGITRLADIAFQVNSQTENIGARRLHTILEKLLDVLSFDASDYEGKSVSITAKYVNEQLAKIAKDEDLSRFIL